MNTLWRRLIHEPLFHFLLLGIVIFLVAGRARNSSIGSGQKIVVTQSQIESIVLGFSRTWMRPPTQDEIRGLVDDYIREEVLYREAKAMGLDQDDVIVRRRMRQKYEFLSEDAIARTGTPTDQELGAYLQQHADKYRQEPRFTFAQIYFSREKRGPSIEAAARETLARLNSSHAPSNTDVLGDPFLLPSRFEKTTDGEMARLFGEKFDHQLEAVVPGHWSGPLESTYGLHLVRVVERFPGEMPALADVRDVVLRDLLNDRRQQALDAQYAKLRARYTVVLDLPETPKLAELR